jgi:nucleotide-binding universal stress UspA family protein
MFKKVVWATDGSQGADQALAVAKTLAAEEGSQLLVIHCEEYTLPGKAGGSMPRAADEDELEVKIKGQVAELRDAGLDATLEMTKSQVGGAAHAIAEVAKREHADLIVVATRGHTALVGLLLGSVPERLLHISPCPVLAVPISG